MVILCVSPWRNTWIDYWSKYLESRGHTVKWHISASVVPYDVQKSLEGVDCILCHWADKYAIMLSDPAINRKPLYVILRSYEIFSADGWSDLGQIRWANVRKLFMLNEAHEHVFKCRVPGVKPILFKNGVDLDEWKPKDVEKNKEKIAWICNINEKKGVELCVQCFHELNKLNPNITLEHIGQNQDIRRWYYLENIMPHLNTKWYNLGYENKHSFVQDFLSDKGFIICSSIAEGNPMNMIEAMAMGVIPLVHKYPGAEYQFPKEYLWANFDELKEIYKREINADSSERIRKFAEENYDYRKNYKPVVDAIEGGL